MRQSLGPARKTVAAFAVALALLTASCGSDSEKADTKDTAKPTKPTAEATTTTAAPEPCDKDVNVPAYFEEAKPWLAKGPTGVCVRAFTELATSWKRS